MNQDGTPNTSFQEAIQLYEANGLPIPPIPTKFTQDISRVDEWVYSTRTDLPSPYLIESYLDELQTQQRPDYVVFGRAGHGLMSYGLHFYLAQGSLALFLQHGWGNADSDPTQDVESIARDYELAEQIIEAIAQAPRIRLPLQLVIYRSNLRLIDQWGLFTVGSGEFMWRNTKPGQVLKTVLDNIQELGTAN